MDYVGGNSHLCRSNVQLPPGSRGYLPSPPFRSNLKASVNEIWSSWFETVHKSATVSFSCSFDPVEYDTSALSEHFKLLTRLVQS
jgi:hypothetical protein